MRGPSTQLRTHFSRRWTAIAEVPDPKTARDGRARDIRTLVIAVTILGGVLAVGVSVQAVFVLDFVSPTARGLEYGTLVDFTRRALLNLATVAVAVVLAIRLRVTERRRPVSAAIIVGVSVLVCAMRLVAQFSFGLFSRETLLQGITDMTVTTSVLSLVLAFALWITHEQQRARRAERAAILPAVRSAEASAAMHQADVRRRRAVAFDAGVSIGSRLSRADRDLVDLRDRLPADLGVQVESIRGELSDLLTGDIRRFSKLLYPASIDDGVVPALRALIGRIPPTIDVALDIASEDDVPATLLTAGLIVAVAEDGISAALLHGRASRLRLALHRGTSSVSITLSDDGRPATEKRLTELDPVRRRIVQRGGHVEYDTTGNGLILRARIPLR